MKKQIYLIVSVLSIVLILIIVKNNYSHYLLSNAEFGMQKLIEQKEVDTLFIGSSVFRQGVDAMVLEERGLKNAYILSYNGNQPFAELLELEYLLEEGVKIENLYLDLYVNSIVANPWISDDKLLLDTDVKFKKKLWRGLSANNEIDAADTIQFWGTANNEILLAWGIYYPIINSSFYRGGTLLETKGMENSTPEEVEVTNRIDEIELNEVQVNAVKKIAKLAADHNIQVTYLEVPQYYAAQSSKQYQERLRKYVNLLKEENIEYILTESSAEQLGDKTCKRISFDSKNPALFSDYVHCSSEGRKGYTEELCERVQ